MDVSEIFDALNQAQREAVGAPPGPVLVLAGAGSGKTRVLTYRIAYLVQSLGISPLSLLAVTFTNKAAREMRGRVETLLGFPVGGMWIGTFHGLAHRLLRSHFEEAGLPKAFEILDSDDQLRIVRRALKELGIDEAYWPPRQVQWYINGHKEEGRRAPQVADSADQQSITLKRLYTHYEALCQRLGLVDFSELLLRTYELFKNNEVIRRHYQERFRHVLVDEFQDTNAIQYRWLRLVSAHHDIMAVGDDDQSIYGWRGAKVENILNFEKDYPGTRTVRLEQNYRSTQH
ncbi:MAG TPA: UvrD-helicase domain-containing protein, partial [Arenicellales bacterium]|nr:UvrD-helicase domain-containing protein [Arenicellales bacterium]